MADVVVRTENNNGEGCNALRQVDSHLSCMVPFPCVAPDQPPLPHRHWTEEGRTAFGRGAHA